MLFGRGHVARDSFSDVPSDYLTGATTSAHGMGRRRGGQILALRRKVTQGKTNLVTANGELSHKPLPRASSRRRWQSAKG